MSVGIWSLAPVTDQLTTVETKIDTIDTVVDGEAVKTTALAAQLTAIQGGSETLETIKTDLEGVLDMTTTAVSTTMTGAELTLFEFVPTAPSFFEGGKIDLTNMEASDTIVVKMYHKIKSGGNYILETSTSYAGAQDPDLKVINGFACRYGVKITATQSAGTNRVIDSLWATSAPGV